tara:strand:- start:60 stop:1100 length:1041 start_codon:yes stop_codon:yes gene_type:complete
MSDKENRTVISIDCMGGDLGEQEVLKGILKSYYKNNSLFFIIHGSGKKLPQLLKKQKKLFGAYKYIEANNVVSMNDKPSQALRKGRDTTMWNAVECVSNGEAQVAISCGNTGALMAMSMMKLKKISGINRPAIAVLWPSTNTRGFNILLDAGADIKADSHDLCQYALMGVSYAKSGFNIQNPRVGILNVGTEEHKGSSELLKAAEVIEQLSSILDFKFIGYVEGDDIPSSKIDVIVTDGFTGNIALKTGEGTATLVRTLFKETFTYSLMAKIASLLAFKPLKNLRKRIDPRRVNGGVFLGLNGTIVKSHGGADAIGVCAAITLASNLTKNNLQKNLENKVIQINNL